MQLLDLPVHVREIILAYLLPLKGPIIFSYPAAPYEQWPPERSQPKRPLDVMRVNSQLYQECLRLLYNRRFQFLIYFTTGCRAAIQSLESFPFDLAKSFNLSIELIHTTMAGMSPAFLQSISLHLLPTPSPNIRLEIQDKISRIMIDVSTIPMVEDKFRNTTQWIRNLLSKSLFWNWEYLEDV